MDFSQIVTRVLDGLQDQAPALVLLYMALRQSIAGLARRLRRVEDHLGIPPEGGAPAQGVVTPALRPEQAPAPTVLPLRPRPEPPRSA